MPRPYIALGLDQQGRQVPTMARHRMDAEDASGMCNTVPGDLAPAEEMQADRFGCGEASPGEVYAVCTIVALATCAALHIVLSVIGGAETMLMVAR